MQLHTINQRAFMELLISDPAQPAKRKLKINWSNGSFLLAWQLGKNRGRTKRYRRAEVRS